jgi:hypothetical protein
MLESLYAKHQKKLISTFTCHDIKFFFLFLWVEPVQLPHASKTTHYYDMSLASLTTTNKTSKTQVDYKSFRNEANLCCQTKLDYIRVQRLTT